jgi:hypothetical protein
MQVRPATAQAAVVAIARAGASGDDLRDEVRILPLEELALMRRQAEQALAEANQQVRRAVEMQKEVQALRPRPGKRRSVTGLSGGEGARRA